MAECLTPYSVRDKISNKLIPVPCGKCPDCIGKRLSGWSFRLQQEAKFSYSSYFITLTYDTEFIPICATGQFTLDKTDLQKYFKRLRKAHEKRYHSSLAPIKYFAVGEYGTKNGRPHYHALIFNAHIDDIENSWRKKVTTSNKLDKYTAEQLHPLQSDILSNTCVNLYPTPQPNFQLISQGIGISYLIQKNEKWHHDALTDRMYIPIEEGKKIAMPRYYKEKIYEKSQRKKIGVAMAEISAQSPELTELEKINTLNAKIKKLKKSRINERL
ncbi:MAG: replication initiator protein [Microviridae sp.]|nr:MAG: replication initiator protein [Microviridae sp.]